MSSFILAGVLILRKRLTLSPGKKGRQTHVYPLGAVVFELGLVVPRKMDYTVYSASKNCDCFYHYPWSQRRHRSDRLCWSKLFELLFELPETSTKSVAFWARRNRLWPQRPCGSTTSAMKALLDSRIGHRSLTMKVMLQAIEQP